MQRLGLSLVPSWAVSGSLTTQHVVEDETMSSTTAGRCQRQGLRHATRCHLQLDGTHLLPLAESSGAGVAEIGPRLPSVPRAGLAGKWGVRRRRRWGRVH